MAGIVGRVRTIALYPAPVLRKKTVPAVYSGPNGALSPPLAQLAADLVATTRDGEGLGMAAPQVCVSLVHRLDMIQIARLCVAGWLRGLVNGVFLWEWCGLRSSPHCSGVWYGAL